MRIAIGGVFHETNSFVSSATTLSDFRDYQLAEGEAMLEYGNTRSEIGGFIAGCERAGATVVPTIFTAAVPGGAVEHADFEVIVDRLVAALDVARPDGVLLCLHGAMSTTACGDADGEVVLRVRDVLDPAVPVVATLDLHANTSDAMVRGLDALVGYDTYPHVDMYERGVEAAELLASGQRRVATHHKVSLITAPQVQYTDVSPMREIMQRVHELEAVEDVVVSVTAGFPYANVDCLGMSVLASGTDCAAATEVGRLLADEVLAQADEFRFEALPVADAVERALGLEGPVVLVDSADNVGGGSPADGTAILEEWLRRNGTGLVVAIADPESVAAAFAAGTGAIARLRVGGKTDDRHGRPVELTARVRLLSDGRYTTRGSYNRGFVVQMGRTAVVETHGNTIVLSERRAMPFDAEQLLSVGVSPAACRALVVKSAVAWRAAYGPYAREVIEVDAPGVCTANIARLPYAEPRRELMRPLPPLTGGRQLLS